MQDCLIQVALCHAARGRFRSSYGNASSSHTPLARLSAAEGNLHPKRRDHITPMGDVPKNLRHAACQALVRSHRQRHPHTALVTGSVISDCGHPTRARRLQPDRHHTASSKPARQRAPLCARISPRSVCKMDRATQTGDQANEYSMCGGDFSPLGAADKPTADKCRPA